MNLATLTCGSHSFLCRLAQYPHQWEEERAAVTGCLSMYTKSNTSCTTRGTQGQIGSCPVTKSKRSQQARARQQQLRGSCGRGGVDWRVRLYDACRPTQRADNSRPPPATSSSDGDSDQVSRRLENASIATRPRPLVKTDEQIVSVEGPCRAGNGRLERQTQELTCGRLVACMNSRHGRTLEGAALAVSKANRADKTPS